MENLFREIKEKFGLSDEDNANRIMLLTSKIAELGDKDGEELAAYQYAILILVAESAIKSGKSKERFITDMLNAIKDVSSTAYDIVKSALKPRV